MYDTYLRIISPTETERCLGFLENWTRSDDADIDTKTGQNRRRNAMGNAFAVPVIARILMALGICLEAPTATAMKLWLDLSLPTRYYPDVLDDIFPVAMELASEFSDLTTDFDD